MRIGFDVSQTGFSRAGTGSYADSLLRAMSRRATDIDWLLYSNFGSDFWDPDHARTTTRIPGARTFHFARTHAEAIGFWGTPPADFERRLGEPAVVHSNNFYCPESLKDARLVYTLHDLGMFEHPDLTTEANRLVCARGIFGAALHADAIIAVSEFTRSHFLDLFPHYPEDQVHVVYPASRFSPSGEKGRPYRHLEPGSFWLAVGTIEPRKNLRFLLMVYADLRARGLTERKLVLAGGAGWLEDGFEAHIRSLGIAEDVIVTGYIDDSVLRWLYAGCFAFVYPSLFEGFGMPVVEALSMGAAVITSNVSSLPEVAGEAGLLVDPEDPADLAAAMQSLEEGSVSVEQLRGLGPPRAAQFSWDRSAERVLGIYETLVRR